jgi:dUTP pyrophosphatase
LFSNNKLVWGRDKIIGGYNILKTIYELSEGAYAPTKAHEYDAGFDIRTPKDVIVLAHDSAVIDTGVRVLIPNGYVGMLKSKSGLNCKNGIVSEGVIDAGYTGTIVAKLYNNSPYDKEFKSGDKITQLVILECPQFELVEGDVQKLETSRGENGFGSTGR